MRRSTMAARLVTALLVLLCVGGRGARAGTIPESFVKLAHAVLDEGTVPPAVKRAVGRRTAEIVGSRTVLDALGSAPTPDTPAAREAVRYAERMATDIHGVGDAEFQALRAFYNDSQIIELTGTVCFFHYWTRVAAGTGENWLPRLSADASQTTYEAPAARVGLLSDATIAAVSAPRPASSLGIGMANSQRAMLQAPALGNAWFGYWNEVRAAATVPREMLLQVSFAVSMANGCRYCTLHQVLGLRRVGVDMGKLVAMQKDDSALTPQERAAVVFARKVTKTPSAVSEADRAALRTVFGAEGAKEIALQAAAFNFMNRFTDGLRLPSEDEAVKTYREVYGTTFDEQRKSSAIRHN